MHLGQKIAHTNVLFPFHGPQPAVYATGTLPRIAPNTLVNVASTNPKPYTLCPMLASVIFWDAVLIENHSTTIWTKLSVVFGLCSFEVTRCIPRASSPRKCSTRLVHWITILSDGRGSSTSMAASCSPVCSFPVDGSSRELSASEATPFSMSATCSSLKAILYCC